MTSRENGGHEIKSGFNMANVDMELSQHISQLNNSENTFLIQYKLHIYPINIYLFKFTVYPLDLVN
jgi:hypothetical protein